MYERLIPSSANVTGDRLLSVFGVSIGREGSIPLGVPESRHRVVNRLS